MDRIRHGARTPDALRNRKVEATSVGSWALTLTAVYQTGPEAVGDVHQRDDDLSPLGTD